MLSSPCPTFQKFALVIAFSPFTLPSHYKPQFLFFCGGMYKSFCSSNVFFVEPLPPLRSHNLKKTNPTKASWPFALLPFFSLFLGPFSSIPFSYAIFPVTFSPFGWHCFDHFFYLSSFLLFSGLFPTLTNTHTLQLTSAKN